MPTEADTTTKKYLCDQIGWPMSGDRRHKPIGILLSYAGKHKHLGDEATVGEHIHQAIRVLLGNLHYYSWQASFTAADLAALELAVCIIEESPPEMISKAQQAWERKEQRR